LFPPILGFGTLTVRLSAGEGATVRGFNGYH
jgi:hypothetical protein